MRIAAIVRSYHNTDFLKEVLLSLNWIDNVLVVNCLHEDYEPAPDDTIDIVLKMEQPNVEILQLRSMKEHEALNCGVAYLSDYDRIFICDADEYLSKEDWMKLTRLGHYDCGVCQMVDVMPDGSEVPREHRPIMVVKPDCYFTFQRCIQDNYKIFRNVVMKHYGYMVKDIDWKIKNYTKLNMNEPLNKNGKMEVE